MGGKNLVNGSTYLENGARSLILFGQRPYSEIPYPKNDQKIHGACKRNTLRFPPKKTGRINGFSNLFLAGTDQGYVGIVGAMLGGIAIANNQILRPG